MKTLKNAFLGLAAGILATGCFIASSRWIGYSAILIFPPAAGLFFGLFRRSLSEALSGACFGIVGILFGMLLFILHGGVLLKTAISLTEAGVPVQLLTALTNPYAWAFAFVAAAPGSMKRSMKAGALAAAICFVGVNLVTFLGPSVTTLNEMRTGGGWLIQRIPLFFTYAINGLFGFVLGVAVHLSEEKSDYA